MDARHNIKALIMHPEARAIFYKLLDRHVKRADPVDHCVVSVELVISVLQGLIGNNITLKPKDNQTLKHEFELMLIELKELQQENDLDAV